MGIRGKMLLEIENIVNSFHCYIFKNKLFY